MLSQADPNDDLEEVHSHLQDFDVVLTMLNDCARWRFSEALKDELFEYAGADSLWSTVPPRTADAKTELEGFFALLQRLPANVHIASTASYKQVANMVADRRTSLAAYDLLPGTDSADPSTPAKPADPVKAGKAVIFFKAVYDGLCASPENRAVVALKSRCQRLVSRIIQWQNIFAIILGQMSLRLYVRHSISDGRLC